MAALRCATIARPWRACRRSRSAFPTRSAPCRAATSRSTTIDDHVFGRTVFGPGWRWSEDVKPIAGTDWCQYHHLGVVVSGRLRVEMADGTTLESGPDTAFEIPPGHDAWVVGDEPWVSIDFAGMRSYGRVDEGARTDPRRDPVTDIVDSTAHADSSGPSWSELLRAHQQEVQYQLDRFRGRLVKTTGDGILAFFDGSERAVRAAAADRRAARGLASRSARVSIPARSSSPRTTSTALRAHRRARIMSARRAWRDPGVRDGDDLVAGLGPRVRGRRPARAQGPSGQRQLFRLAADYASRAGSERPEHHQPEDHHEPAGAEEEERLGAR